MANYVPEIRLMLRKRDKNGANTNDLTDITALCSGIQLEGEIKAASRKLTFTVIRDKQDYYLGNIENVKRGDGICLVDYKTKDYIFYGNVWETTEDDSDPIKHVICYDSIKFLMTSQAITSVFTNVTAIDVTKKVCKELGVTVGDMPKTDKLINVNARGKTGYEAIMIAWTETHKQDEKIYYPRMVGYRLNVIEKGELLKGEHMLLYESEPRKCNLISVQVNESSESAITALFNRNEDGTATFDKSDKKLVNRLGYIVAVNDDSGQGKKQEINDGKKTMKVEAIGDWAVQTGWSVTVKSKLLREAKLYIEKDTHTFENGIHTMELDLSYENVMDEIENQEEKKEINVDGELGGGTVQEQVWNFLRAHGFSAEATAGVMGNMERESGFNVGITETGGTGYGLVQWTNTYENPPHSFRRTKLENWCKSKGLAVNSVEGQMSFLMHEYDTYYAPLIKNSTGLDYKKINDVYTATDTWLTYFEGATVRNGIVAFNVRITAAKRYYNQWKNYIKIPSRGSSDGDGKSTGTFMWPIKGGAGTYIRGFTGNCRGCHLGVDISTRGGYGAGAIVVASDGGVVVSAGNGVSDWSYGNEINIKHKNGLYTRYGHLNEIDVRVGQKVTKGQRIGVEGSTGNVTGTHLHFEVHRGIPNGIRLNPMNYIHR